MSETTLNGIIGLGPTKLRNKLSNFYLSFLFLSKAKRDAIETVYAFCRFTDDIVDEGKENEKQKYVRLIQWTEELQRSVEGKSRFALLNHLSTIIQKFHIPLQPFFELIRGMEMDLEKHQYRTFEELELYCYRVASTVGLISSEIFGYKNQETKQYAINLGIALQLTNILRDVKQDAQNGRIYIPKEDLERFGYSEEDIRNSVYDERFRALMRFECDRARDYYRKAARHLFEEDKTLFAAARAMGNIYYQLLQNIERANYNVFTNRICLSLPRKMFIIIILHLRNMFPVFMRRRFPVILPV